MKFKIPFVYHARVVPPYRRKHYPLSFVDEVEVAAMTVPSAQAEIVAEWEHPDRYSGETDRGCVRLYGGVLYAARTAWDDGLCEFSPVSPSDLKASDVLLPDEGAENDGEVLERFLADGEMIPFDHCRSVENCDREAVEETVRERVGRMIVVDGHVWEPCGGPMLVIDFAHSTPFSVRADTTMFTDAVKCEGFLARLPREWYEKPIVLDRGRPELLEAIRELVSDADRPYLPTFIRDDIPDALCGRVFEQGVLAFARNALDALTAPLETFDDGGIMAWVRLRREADRLEASLSSDDGGDEGIETVLDAMEAVVGMTDGRCSFRLELLSRIWDAREIAPGFAGSGLRM